MLKTIWEFILNHVIYTFLRGMRNFVIGKVVRRVFRALKGLTAPEMKADYLCRDCSELFTKDYLYEEYWFSRKMCPSCGAFDSIRYRAQVAVEQQNPVRIYHLPQTS